MTEIPPPFYFNGETLSGWSTQWSFYDFDELSLSPWDEFIDVQHIWHLSCRIDHTGSIESEDPDIFRICVQEVLSLVLTQKEKIFRAFQSDKETNAPNDEIYLEIVKGLCKMLELCARHKCAIWTSGEPTGCEKVLTMMDQISQPRDNPDSAELPHISQRKDELFSRSQSQLKKLRALASSGTLSKEVRKLIHQLPEKKSV